MKVFRFTVPSPMAMLEVDSIEPLLLRTRTVASEVADPSNACKSHCKLISCWAAEQTHAQGWQALSSSGYASLHGLNTSFH